MRIRTICCGGGASDVPSTLTLDRVLTVKRSKKTSGKNVAGEPRTAEFEALNKVVEDLGRAVRALPEAERAEYRQAQQSVVDARRRAGMQEGLLQVN